MYAGRPPFARAIARGLVARCPSCGGRGVLRSWFRVADRCPTCGLKLEQGQGAFLGSMAINYAAGGLTFFAVLGVWLWVALPDINALALTATSLATVTVTMAAFFPSSKMLWAALSLFLHDPGDIDRKAEGMGGTDPVEDQD